MIALRPSGSNIWTKCAANPLFSAHAPKQPDSDAAREGTCAAWVAETVLKDEASSAVDMNGKTHPNGWLVTLDMVQHVQGYIDLVRSRGVPVSAEGFVRLNDFIAGTFDSSVDGSAVNGWVFVDDLKYGQMAVEVFENTQVLIYAEAKTREIEAAGGVIEWVQLGIYQPRVWHPDGYYRTWKMSRSELARWAEWIITRGNLCQLERPIAEPGNHCRYCDAASVCAANAFTLQKSFEIVRDNRHRQLTREELATELDFLDRAEAVFKGRRTAIAAEAEARIKKGEFVRGYYMKPRKGNRTFKVNPVTIKAMTGIDPRSDAMVTPAELERRGANVKTVALLTYQPDIPSVLAKLPENAIRKAFEK